VFEENLIEIEEFTLYVQQASQQDQS